VILSRIAYKEYYIFTQNSSLYPNPIDGTLFVSMEKIGKDKEKRRNEGERR